MHARDMRSTQRQLTRLAGLLVLCAALVALGWHVRPHAEACAIAEDAGSSADSSATTTAPSPTPRPPLPLRMARIGDARQLIVATGSRIGSKTGTLQFFDWEHGAWVCKMTVPARFGRRGLMDGAHRREGNKTTPTGLWKMPAFAFGYSARPPAGTKLRYRRITKRSWWSSQRGRTYNTWVEAKRWRGERLYHVHPQYEFAISAGYNAKPNRSIYGRGSGIFLHVQGRGLTSGCVAISRGSMVRVVRMLDPAKHPAFAVGTLQRGSGTSIWAY